MKREKPGLLSLPAGSGTLLHDAVLQRALASKLDKLYESWTYVPVHTPIVDYEDAYTRNLGVSLPPATYRLLDREGHVLALRSDITLFLVKQIHRLLPAAQLPLRLCYTDSIVRYHDRSDIEKNEFYQSGAELIGTRSRDADLELLCLFAEALAASRCPEPAVHLGSAQIFSEIFGERLPAFQTGLRHAISMRDWKSVEGLFLDDFSSGATSAVPHLLKLFGFIGTPEQFEAALSELAKAAGPGLRSRLEELADRASSFAKLNPQLKVRVDLSELGTQAYHSGIVFRAYIDGSDSAVAAGGRYDTLLGGADMDVPAIGFSIMVSKIIRKLENGKSMDTVKNIATGASFEERLAEARKLRAQGRNVQL